MKCPKCGHEQPDGGLDCGRCGIVFSRYRPPGAPSPASGAPPPPPTGSAGAANPPLPPGLLAPPLPPAPPTPLTPQATPARSGGWEPAVVGSALAGHGAGAGASRWAGEQLYEGPAVATTGGGGDGKVEIEERHELTGRLYEGPPALAGEAAVGMALRPAPRSTGTAGAAAVFKFSFGAVIGDTFSIFAKNLLPFLLIAAVIVSPLAVAGFLAAAMGNRAAIVTLAAAGLVELVLAGPLVSGAITFGVAQELRHREASIADCLRRALSGVFAILGVAILEGLVVLGGFFLCVVPGLIASVMLCVAVPAALEERCGVMAALHSSADLTRGHRWQVAGVLLTFGTLQGVMSRLVLFALPGGATAHLLPAAAVSIVGTALQATANAVMYYRLRSATEGVDVARLASIFD
jgi:hypothetical protein